MKLQILIPQYKETDEIVKNLLDSIKNQIDVNFNDIGVIIVNDGTNIRLSNGLLTAYPFEIKYILNKHKGVSATRNRALDEATAEYIMFCDADDIFFNSLGLRIILRTIETTYFDSMNSCFVEELKDPRTGKFEYPIREDDIIFVHGKVYNRKFLLDNNIRWCDELLVHEDSYFNCLATYCSKSNRYCPTAFYLWRWNDNSVSRSDPYYIIKTYDYLIKSADKLSEDLLKHDLPDKSAQMFLINMWQTFFLITGKYTEVPDLQPKIKELSKQFIKFYDKYKYLLEATPERIRTEIYQNCKKTAIERNWYMDKISLEDWLKQNKMEP